MQKQNGLSVSLLQRKYRYSYKYAEKILREMLLEYPEIGIECEGRSLIFKRKLKHGKHT